MYDLRKSASAQAERQRKIACCSAKSGLRENAQARNRGMAGA
jgi:hypothetical protein